MFRRRAVLNSGQNGNSEVVARLRVLSHSALVFACAVNSVIGLTAMTVPNPTHITVIGAVISTGFILETVVISFAAFFIDNLETGLMKRLSESGNDAKTR